MTKSQVSKATNAEAKLVNALKARLAALTQGLGDADVGGRGIDLVKEIKELYSIISALNPDVKAQKADNTKVEVGWTEWENMPKATAVQQAPPKENGSE